MNDMILVPDWIVIVFLFAFGACVGSFLNVVIYRLPRDKSLVSPPSACPKCQTPIAFYDNIPIISWLLLGGACRKCKGRISLRYPMMELLTALMFVLLYVLYFRFEIKSGLGTFFGGGWYIYLVHIILISAFLAASAIDLELWVIPISICWLVSAVGIASGTLAGLIYGSRAIETYNLFPTAAAGTCALSAGALVGLVLALVLLAAGVLRRSYESEEPLNPEELAMDTDGRADEDKFNHRCEMFKEILFLLPIIAMAGVFYGISKKSDTVSTFWLNASQIPAVSGFFACIWGYFIGCGIVWITRIFGTLAFGKEAMGLGDVHLMGAAGAVVGPVYVAIAFFVAPFFGLGWAMAQMFFKKTRQIPYGPFLSLAVFGVIIFSDQIREYLNVLFFGGK